MNFAYIYGYLGGGTAINDLAMISMLVRNLMVVGMLVLVFMEMVRIRRKGRSGDDADVPYGFRRRCVHGIHGSGSLTIPTDQICVDQGRQF